jgi:hypothetical protein
MLTPKGNNQNPSDALIPSSGAPPADPRNVVPTPLPSTPVERVSRESWLAKGIFESILIVFSILLAFVLNEWREGRAKKANLIEARQMLSREIASNRETLLQADFLPHHERLLSLYQGSPSNQSPIMETGVHPSPLRDGMWRAVSNREVFGEIRYDELVVLADLYQEQTQLETLHRAMQLVLLTPRAEGTPLSERGSEWKATGFYLSDVVASERRLLRRYDEALQLLAH